MSFLCSFVFSLYILFQFRYSPTEDPQWSISLQYNFSKEMVEKVKTGQLSDEDRAKHLGVIQYSKIRLPYDKFISFMKEYGSQVLPAAGLDDDKYLPPTQPIIEEEEEEEEEVVVKRARK